MIRLVKNNKIDNVESLLILNVDIGRLMNIFLKSRKRQYLISKNLPKLFVWGAINNGAFFV